jgi:hypothetical protein
VHIRGYLLAEIYHVAFKQPINFAKILNNIIPVHFKPIFA